MKLRRTLVAVFLVCLAALLAVGCGSSQKTASQIYKNAEVITLAKGATAPGKISVVKINSKELSQADLEDWYYNYAKPALAEKKFNSCVIAYTDKPGLGITYNQAALIKDATVTLEKQAPAANNSCSEGTIMVETDGGKNLKPLKFG